VSDAWAAHSRVSKMRPNAIETATQILFIVPFLLILLSQTEVKLDKGMQCTIYTAD
jgi:hypothetical protein